MTKFIDTLNNLVKLIGSLVTFAVLGGMIFGGLWVYQKVGEMTSKPIQLPSVTLPTIKMPEIKMPEVKLPEFNLFGNEATPTKSEVETKEAWTVWRAKTEAACAALPQHKAFDQWQDEFSGMVITGAENLPPPGANYWYPGGGPAELHVYNWHWIGSKPIGTASDREERVRAGEKLGKWINKKDYTYVFGWQDKKPSDKGGRILPDGTEYIDYYDWVWLGNNPVPPKGSDIIASNEVRAPSRVVFLRNDFCNHTPKCTTMPQHGIVRALAHCKTKPDGCDFRTHFDEHRELMFPDCQHSPKCADKDIHWDRHLMDEMVWDNP